MDAGSLAVSGSEDSLSSRVLDILRDRIIRGDYPPGTRLRERELAEELNVSRIPLREALPQLEAEGFIVTLPRRGATVTQLTLRDAQELFEVRLGLEVYATRLAALRVREGADPSLMQAAMDSNHAALELGDIAEISEASARLHREVVALSGNDLLVSIMRTVFGRDRWVFQLASDQEPALACEEHRRLCETVAAGDADLAAALAYAHIDACRARAFNALAAVLPDAPWDPAAFTEK